MMKNYVMNDEGDPVVESDLRKWAEWFEKADRKLSLDVIEGVKISTVFLGLDHSFYGGTPVLYETMVFGGFHDEYQKRYTNKVAALAGHDQAMAMVRDSDGCGADSRTKAR